MHRAVLACVGCEMMETLAHVDAAGPEASCDSGTYLYASHARDGTGGHGNSVGKSLFTTQEPLIGCLLRSLLHDFNVRSV